MDQLILYSISY